MNYFLTPFSLNFESWDTFEIYIYQITKSLEEYQ